MVIAAKSWRLVVKRHAAGARRGHIALRPNHECREMPRSRRVGLSYIARIVPGQRHPATRSGLQANSHLNRD